MTHRIDCDMDEDCTCEENMPEIKLTRDELSLLSDAIDTHVTDQLPDEDGWEERIALCEKLGDKIDRIHAAARTVKRGFAVVKFNKEAAGELAEALDSHLYWSVSDPRDRNDGFVFWDPDEDEEGSKMARDDRSPEYVEACRRVATLHDRFEALAS